MKAPRNLNRGTLGINLTPMIDVVFLLIVFFLVSSHLARQEAQVELTLPLAKSGDNQPPDETRRLIVNVLPDGGLLISGEVLPAERLGELISRSKTLGDGQLEVRIRADRQVPYRFVEPIMIACARAGVWRVSFAVEPD